MPNLLLLLALSPQQQGQGSDPIPLSDADGYSYVAAPPGSVPAVFRKCVAADLDGDLLTDLTVVRDGELDVLFSPAITPVWHRDVHPDAGSLEDAATFEQLGNSSTLVVVGSDGLESLAYDGSGWSSESFGTSDWLGARRVETRYVAGEATPRIYGLAQNSVLSVANAGEANESEVLHFVSPETVIDFAPIEWDALAADPEPYEIAVLTATGLRIYDGSGGSWTVVTQKISTGFTPTVMAVGRSDFAPTEWITWIAAWNADPTQEAIASSSVLADAQPKWLSGDPGAAALHLGDWRGSDANPGALDGIDEALLTHRADHSLSVLHPSLTDPPVYKFTAGDKDTLQFGTGPALDTESNAVLADLDNDGQVDIAFPVNSSGGVFIDRNGPTGALDNAKRVRAQNVGLDCIQQAGGNLHIEILLPETWPPGTDAIEVALFEELPGQPTNEVSVAYECALVENLGPGVTVDLEYPITYPNQAIYYWVQQCVDFDDGEGEPHCGNTVWQTMAPQVYGIQLTVDSGGDPTTTINHATLEAIANGEGFSVFAPVDECGGSGGGTVVGSGFPIPNVPNLEAGASVIIQP